MATSPSQRKTAGRVMHEFRHGELKSGPGGAGGKVTSRRQAIAIALSESGDSIYKSDKENERSLRRSKAKEASGDTAQQEREGKSHVGAADQRESSRATGGKDATRKTAAGTRAARTRARNSGEGSTKADLYRQARQRGVPGRSKMSKQQLDNALHR